ncbi:MAG: hypothetical protein ACI9NT_001722 [Bacteroidia bacterium]
MKFQTTAFVILSFALGVSQPSTASDVLPDKGKITTDKKLAVGIAQSDYSPYAGRDFPHQVFFGDTHLHTAVSVDAGTMNTVGQEDAFRFARGEEITTTHGLRARLSRPLDFLVLTDHAEMYGLMPQLLSGDPAILATEMGKRWYDMLKTGDPQKTFDAAMEIVASLSKKDPPIESSGAARKAWETYAALADKYNDPGQFSALIGYEWTALGGNNLHRNVVFRGDAKVALQTDPFSQFDSQNPEDLWRALAQFSESTGAQVLAIPHNGNLSTGRMFSVTNFDGSPLSKELAELRARMEPLMEATQIKGDGEAHPFLSPDDEFADYETWDAANLNGTELKEDSMLQYEYAREALKTGLKLEKSLGVNPYRFGMIGSTDSHTSMATAEEENFFGKHSGVEPEPHRWEHMVISSPLDPDLAILGWQQAAAGYAGVWATENSREAIFDAMRRKEVYATTGPRMTVRFFGGWSFDKDDIQNRTPAYIGYQKGVPMGGELGAASAKAPSFMVAAAKDPYSGNLDRIQIIKGWIDSSGESHEKVYDVVWSDDRKPRRNGKLPPVGNTVNVEKATWLNSIGEPELIAVWQDPDFNSQESAFYYARVIEIPTPRWTAYEAKRYRVKMDNKVPMTTQERAYTSPIWYTP